MHRPACLGSVWARIEVGEVIESNKVRGRRWGDKLEAYGAHWRTSLAGPARKPLSGALRSPFQVDAALSWFPRI